MTSDRPWRRTIAALCAVSALAGCATSNSAPGASGLAGKPQAAVPVPVPPAAMAEPPPEVPPGPPSPSYAYRGGRDPLTGLAAVTEGAPEPLQVDGNGAVVQPKAKQKPGVKPHSAKSAAAGPRGAAAVPAPPGGGIVVQKGDTLYGLAQRYRVTVSGLMSANGLTSASIVPGQRLVLPR